MKKTLDHMVLMEGHDTFSAWPILFNCVDSVGWLFDKYSELEIPALDRAQISFTFWAKQSGRGSRPLQLMTLVVGTVLRWRLVKEGLWLRGGFIEEAEQAPKDIPLRSVQDRLRSAIKDGRIALTYASYEASKDRVQLEALSDGSGNHYVKHFPLLAFALYEIPREAPTDAQQETLPTEPRLSQAQ